MQEKWVAINLLFLNKPEFNMHTNLFMIRCLNLLCQKDELLFSEDSNADRNEKAKEERNDV